MLPGRAGALCGAGRAPGRRRRNGPRAIGLGAAGLAVGRVDFRAGFFALALKRLTGARLVGRLPLPAPLPFFFAMARSRCLPVVEHFHIKPAIYSSPISLAESLTC